MFKGLTYRIAYYLLMVLCYREACSFKRSLSRIKIAQEKLLLRIIKDNGKTEFGKRHHFSAIKSIADFKARVPVTSYEDYKCYIDLIARGDSNILTREKVLLFEPSSGSVSSTKYIPYTPTLKKQFQRATLPWLYDIAVKNRGVTKGSSYWSISPSVNLCIKSSYGSMPVGFEQDAEYFGPALKHILKVLLVVPQEVGLIEDINAFRYVTLLFLLREKELTFISVWNPTFLTLLYDPLLSFAPSLINDIGKGTLSPPVRLPENLTQRLLEKLPKDETRAAELKFIFNSAGSMPEKADLFKNIWPNLCFISCWGDGNAANHLSNLRQMFPGVVLQPKGLLATEGVVSFPLTEERESVLSINSHFFEFLEIREIDKHDDAQHTVLAHELQLGKSYSVIITTGGGLYRYRLNDIIEVVGFKEKCPLVRFLGKEDKISDICGEKLNERHVVEALNGAFETCKLKPRFFMMAPLLSKENKYSYAIFLQFSGGVHVSYEMLFQLRTLVERRLKENYHYSYCRKLGQLQELDIFLITPESNPAQDYLQYCQKQGQRLGGIKALALDSRLDWAGVFQGCLIENKSFYTCKNV